MPFAPLKPCPVPGCAELVAKGKCDAHRVKIETDTRLEKGSAWKRGYDADWDRVRLKALKRDHYVCQGECKDEGRMVPAQHVDHIHAFRGKKDPLRLDLKNLKSLCKPCHSRKTAREDGGFGRPRN